MAWTPFFAAGVINGVGHYCGYRNFESSDASSNIIPIGIFIGGEELHNNHHAFASSAKFSNKRWEFDLGWQYIQLLAVIGLAKVRRIAPTPRFNDENSLINYDTVCAIISNRWHVMSDYAHEVIGHVHKDEMRKANMTGRTLLRRGKKLMSRADSLLDMNARLRLESILEHSDTLNEVYMFKQRLQEIWTEKTATRETLVRDLQNWCREAESTGIVALEEFSLSIKAYTLQPITN
jgi:stearoyl-CoA desaturase (delta-9 desaturase)